jgi:hypothetical protein
VVVVHNNVLNGLVIDQVVMIIAVNRMNIVVASDLDHHVQKEMNQQMDLGKDI